MPSSDHSSRTHFFVSGFPKSGNKWLQQMLIAFDGVGGFHVDPARGMPLLASAVFDEEVVWQALKARDLPIEAVMRRLYAHSAAEIEVPRADDADWLAAMRTLAAESAKVRRANVRADAFHDRLTGVEVAVIDESKWQVIGVPGMHTPLEQVRRLLPSFRIISLQRDPRDVVVSYFYHYVATLTQPLAEKLVHWDAATGAIEHNPKWKRPFARRVMRNMLDYHAQRMPGADEARDGVLRVRYEELLHDGVGQLQRILRFVGCEASAAEVTRIVEAHRFERVTGSSQEQRGSLTRKGRSGDWRNYFDRELLRALGDEFPVIVRDLGYERDDAWMQDVPRQAPREFEFSRFRIKRSTTRQFAHLWNAAPELQAKFPNPWDVEESESFYAWLCACDDPQVRAWLQLARRLEELWSVDVVER